MRFGAIETGGTKVVCAIGDEAGTIQSRRVIPTTTPEETMPRIWAFFEEEAGNAPAERTGGEGKEIGLSAIGIAAFGPVDLNPDSPSYGSILETPKSAWRHFPLLEAVRSRWGIPCGLDTDVNAACLGEMTFGTAKGLTDVLYLTIGTGIGAGIAVGGKLLHGMLHPEAGHIFMEPEVGDEGHCICPYHTNCFEGLASGPSLFKRWGLPAEELSGRDEVWELESTYVARALLQYIYTVSPQRIILGGGVMHEQSLFTRIRDKVLALNHGYITTSLLADIDHYIVPASLKDDQGIMGCLQLAKEAMEKENRN